jgi:hypothetical protein
MTVTGYLKDKCILNPCLIQAFNVKWMRTALFWVIMQQVMVFSYRCFGSPEDGTDRLSQNIGKKLPLHTVITEKSAVLKLNA